MPFKRASKLTVTVTGTPEKITSMTTQAFPKTTAWSGPPAPSAESQDTPQW